MSKEHSSLSVARRKALSDQRKQRGWSVARKVAKTLKETYGAEQVVAFGSLVRGVRFVEGSDIDLAVKGLSGRRFFRAVGDVVYSDHEFGIDVLDLDTCPPPFRARIEREGISL